MNLGHTLTRSARRSTAGLTPLLLALGAFSVGGCASSTSSTATAAMPAAPAMPAADPRVGLKAGMMDAEEAAWNLRVVSKTQPSEKFAGVTNSDISFTGHYAIQGNYNGFQVWDVSNPAKPTLTVGFLCPASQSDVSVYKNLLFVSGEGNSGRLDCGTVEDADAAEPVGADGVLHALRPRATCRCTRTCSSYRVRGIPDASTAARRA